MTSSRKRFTGIEPLEARIAPAAVYPTLAGAERAVEIAEASGNAEAITAALAHFKTVAVGGPTLLQAGDVLTTGTGSKSGSYLMFVEQGQALVFTTDLNNNNVVDFNEITGIAAGDGLRLISFMDIHGDVVTNLKSNGTLTDSDANSSNDDPGLKGDGLVLLNSRIEKIELRSLRAADLTDQDGDGQVDVNDIGLRIVLSSYSLFGQILAGGGFGVASDNTSGLTIDDTGKSAQQQFFPGPIPGSPYGPDYFDTTVTPLKPMIGGIVVGSAASGEYFSFGYTKNSINDPSGVGATAVAPNHPKLLSNGNDIQGTLRSFTPAAGTAGAGIAWVRGATTSVLFDIGRLVAGDGGQRAPGGNIENVTLNGDITGGYSIIAGNGGGGASGGNGGSILNFEDLGSNTGTVLIHSGTGGTGATGSGGAGGVATFGTMNVLGSILIQEGDGGSGFVNGGTGASLGKSIITSPDRLADFARNIVGTTHDSPHNPVTGLRIIADPLRPGIIGQGNAVDFDGDGIGDIVFTSSNPSQLVVQFGDGNGGFRRNPVTGNLDRIYLEGAIDAEALTIGDFDGDGHYDIATGSSSGGNHGGVVVFLSKYEDTNHDGILTKSEDLNGNGKDDIIGFRAPRYSTLPSLTDAVGAPFGAARSAHAISDVEAGDFNGDGFTDLAISATYYEPITLAPFQFVLFMYSDIEDGKPTGQFLADFGTKAQAVPPQGASPLLPAVIISGRGATTANIEVTALNETSGHDVVVALVPGGGTLQVLDNSVPSIAGPLVTAIPTGTVDLDRDLPDLASSHIQLLRGNLPCEDFAIIDFDHDGLSDYVAISANGLAGYMVVLQGDGLGGGLRTDLNSIGVQNAGFYFGPPTNGVGGLNLTTSLQAIIGTDADGDGFRDEVAVLLDVNTPATLVVEMSVGFPPNLVPLNPMVGVVDNPGAARFSTIGFTAFADPTIRAFDAYYPTSTGGGVPDTTVINYAIGEPESLNDGVNFIDGAGDYGGGFMFTTEYFFRIEAGDGGSGLIGRGGNGGGLGDAALTVVNGLAIGSIDIRINLGDVQLVGGKGGNGFSSGGAGGTIKGAVVDGSLSGLGSLLTTTALAGDGGLAVSGAGGKGGDIVGLSLFAGGTITAGDGGRGVTGGNGGSILGNGQPDIYDTQDLFQRLTAGDGGDGIKRGGNGGSVLNFHSSLDLNSTLETGTLIYLGGNGGTAVSGAGGNGGGVINSSPLANDRNQLAGDIYLAGGHGGNGRSGGAGGSVDTFINKTDQTQVPAIVSFLGGDGGNGTKGPAGNGGSVKNVLTASAGAPNPFGFSTTAFTFSRVIAGRGGDSSGSNGGNGGDVSGINLSAKDNPLVLVGGAGGDGLFRGGSGGSVLNSLTQVGNTSLSKSLIIAGEGGDANAYLANVSDPIALQTALKAYGGKIGHGGNGGGIFNITQRGGVLTRMDLIAGNGGDSVNYGTVADLSSYVGRGGSISKVYTEGSIGNLDAQVPIKSYNDIRSGETMGEFVQHSLRDESAPGSVDDSVGNVGIVTGAAGRVKSLFNGYNNSNQPVFPTTPAAKGINGSLTSITARNIMSAVAGNVERIAAIQTVKDIHLTAAGVIGADKDTFNDPDNTARFLTRDLKASFAPVLDGILVDGAMVSRARPTDLSGHVVNLGADVYILA